MRGIRNPWPRGLGDWIRRVCDAPVPSRVTRKYHIVPSWITFSISDSFSGLILRQNHGTTRIELVCTTTPKRKLLASLHSVELFYSRREKSSLFGVNRKVAISCIFFEQSRSCQSCLLKIGKRHSQGISGKCFSLLCSHGNIMHPFGLVFFDLKSTQQAKSQAKEFSLCHLYGGHPHTLMPSKGKHQVLDESGDAQLHVFFRREHAPAAHRLPLVHDGRHQTHVPEVSAMLHLRREQTSIHQIRFSMILDPSRRNQEHSYGFVCHGKCQTEASRATELEVLCDSVRLV